MAQVIYYYGSRPDIRDNRDLRKVYSSSQIPTSPTVDLRRYINHVYDQGSLSSCIANALCAAYGLDLMRQSLTLSGGYYYFNPSRLFLYYNTREHEGNANHDSGTSIRNAIKALKRQGVCRESDWPYLIKEYKTKPPSKCYEAAEGNSVSQYERLTQDVNQLRACLNDNCPFVFGFNVYHSFHDYNNQKYGDMSVPTYYEKSHEPLGRHAAMAVGYDDSKKHIIVLNSWGGGWGDRGYFYMPYDFMVDSSMCYDFWKISFSCERGRSDPGDFKRCVVAGNGDTCTTGYEMFSSDCDDYSSDYNEYVAPYQYGSSCCYCCIQ